MKNRKTPGGFKVFLRSPVYTVNCRKTNASSFFFINISSKADAPGNRRVSLFFRRQHGALRRATAYCLLPIAYYLLPVLTEIPPDMRDFSQGLIENDPGDGAHRALDGVGGHAAKSRHTIAEDRTFIQEIPADHDDLAYDRGGDVGPFQPVAEAAQQQRRRQRAQPLDGSGARGVDRVPGEEVRQSGADPRCRRLSPFSR